MNSVAPTPRGARAQQLALDATAIATGGYEAAPVAELRRDVLPRVLELVDAAIRFADDVAAEGDDPGAAPAPAQDIAFVCGMDLRGRREHVVQVSETAGDALTQDNAPELLVACDSAARRVIKAVGAIDQALAEVESRPPVVDFASELAAGLRVRRLFSKFRRRLRAPDEPGPGKTLVTDVRALGIQIAVLAGANDYPDIRLGDRMTIRSLQRRVLAWLRQPDDGDAGRRILQDARAFADMLPQINQRQVLVEHDARHLRDAERALGALPENETVPDGVWAMVEPLEGLDDELDLLLALRNTTVSTLALALSEAAGGPNSTLRLCVT